MIRKETTKTTDTKREEKVTKEINAKKEKKVTKETNEKKAMAKSPAKRERNTDEEEESKLIIPEDNDFVSYVTRDKCDKTFLLYLSVT